MQATDFIVTNIRGVSVVYFQSPEQAHRKIVLDFGQVRFLSSQTLGVLINLNKKVEQIKGKLIICGLRPELSKVFKVTRLDKLLKFARDEEAALNEFGVSGRT